MYGNGAETGIAKLITGIALPFILKDPIKALNMYYAGAVGIQTIGLAGWQHAQKTTLPLSLPTMAFGSL
jgi:hypothetical protein